MHPTFSSGLDDRRSRLETKQNDYTLSRSPKPYHRRGSSLRHHEGSSSSSDLDVLRRHAQSNSDSHDHALEADDEKGPLLRTLPAPPLRERKGLRGHSSPLDLTPGISPIPTPRNEESSFDFSKVKSEKEHTLGQEEATIRKQLQAKHGKRRNAEIVRRTTEFLVLGGTALLTAQKLTVWYTLCYWSTELFAFFLVVSLTYAFYPFRSAWSLWREGWSVDRALYRGFHVPSRFDPGPLLYPVFLPVMLTASLETGASSIFLANMVLGLATIPPSIIPLHSCSFSLLHWVASLLPASVHVFTTASPPASKVVPNEPHKVLEMLACLYPLHFSLVRVVQYLTTTSLDPAEAQLLAVGLSNLLIYASTPQAQVLKALLWVGGTTLLVLCDRVLCWEVALARIPAWKFARNKPSRTGFAGRINRILRAIMPEPRTRFASSFELSDSDEDEAKTTRARRTNPQKRGPKQDSYTLLTRVMSNDERYASDCPPVTHNTRSLGRAATFGTFGRAASIAVKWRRLASLSSSSPFLRLTYLQAQALKWGIAVFVYTTIVLVIMIPIRYFVAQRALNGAEPFGWAIGYLAGDLQRLRMFAVSNGVDAWIKLPVHRKQVEVSNTFGWVEDGRQRTVGAANTRLFLAAYCLAVIAGGLVAVFKLQRVVEVDTRRKVFHGVMVAMLLPTIPVDPCFFALALVVMLGVFLMLDILRAAQLPPVSRPLTTFLAPYVDGRDHRGPVVVSHIFLLIGCAIPLWLSLANVGRSGTEPWAGWEVPMRDVSMVSGIVCVGMGDAAASLVGRRYGRTKWYWGGGKSLEGSAAFAVAVTCGLSASYTWLRVGGWIAWDLADLPGAVLKAAVAGIGASIMESTLTAANDNVVVPIGLWLLVRGLGI